MVGWFFSYCFFYLLFLFNAFLCITFLPNDRAEAIPADIGTTIKPTPVTDEVLDVVVAPPITTVSTDSSIEVRVF